jgi:hypothetical protein
MEKIRFHHFRLFTSAAISALLLITAVAEESAVQSVMVDIESPIEGENIAKARENSRNLAFEKAVDQALPATTDQTRRAELVKKASSFVKGFRIVEEKVEGNTLKLKYKVEIEVPSENPVVPRQEGQAIEPDQKATFEVAWLPDEVQFNAVDLLKYVSDVMATPASSVRIGRGNIVLTLQLKKSLQETQTQLASFVGRRGLVKVIHRDENRPPDILPAPVQVPLASPSSDSAQPSQIPVPSGVPAPIQSPVVAPAQSPAAVPSTTPAPSGDTFIIMTPPPTDSNVPSMDGPPPSPEIPFPKPE